MQTSKLRNGASSPNKNKNSKNRGIKSTERASPRSPLPEKKHTSKVSELEEELKKAKELLISLDSQKKRAQQEAEESKKQVLTLSAKLEDSKQQLIELSDSEDSRIQELRKLSQERDRSWQTELEALQKQHSADTAALSSSINEVQRLKKQLEILAESEATAHEDVQCLRTELSETMEMVNDAKLSEANAIEAMNEAQIQLEAIKAFSLENKEAYDSVVSELEKSKAQVSTLEELVSQLHGNARNTTDFSSGDINALKSALEASEARYQNEYIQSTLQIRVAYEAVERVKVESSLKETALTEELKKAKEEIEELKSDLSSKTEASEEESELTMEMKKLEEELVVMKSALLDKETQLQTLGEENEILRTEISKVSLSDEVNHERSWRSTKFGELLDMTQMEKAELEAELRKLKVQADQWRKAAEAAAAILSPDCDSKTVSVDMFGMKMDSGFFDSMDEDSLKKKNANMLKKIGGLWKKGQK